MDRTLKSMQDFIAGSGDISFQAGKLLGTRRREIICIIEPDFADDEVAVGKGSTITRAYDNATMDVERLWDAKYGPESGWEDR